MQDDEAHRVGQEQSSAAETAFWDSWNTDYRQTENVEPGSVPDIVGRVVVAATEALELESPRIVEIGCGTGWLARSLSGLGQYTGWDLSPRSVELARRNVEGARFEVRDVHDGVQPASADVVVMVDTIAYFRDQDAALRNVSAMVVPDGYLVVTTVNPFVYSRMSWIGPPGDGQVRTWLTKDRLHALIEQNSFTIRSSRTVLPDGDTGVLRWTNSRKLNRPVERLIGRGAVVAAKERVGLGQYRVVVARRRAE
jgi:2-polyprenyl-3-methyl-5-hydroxy-6-metoxy-1,4-benzoquinol methylase